MAQSTRLPLETPFMSFKRSLTTIALALTVAWPAVQAQQAGRVTVVTSFSKDVTDPVKRAFEKAVPGQTLDVQNRNTNAGVKYLEETRGNNQTDVFWASAPATDDWCCIITTAAISPVRARRCGMSLPDRVNARRISFSPPAWRMPFRSDMVRSNTGSCPMPVSWSHRPARRSLRPRKTGRFVSGI